MDKKFNSVEAFLQEPSFHHWVHSSDPKAYAQWEAWRAKHPRSLSLMDEAKEVVRGIQFRPHEQPAEKIKASWQKLVPQLREYDHRKKFRKRKQYLSRMGMAASVLAILSILYVYLPQTTSEVKWITHETAYSGVDNIILPDGSSVILNRNSRIKYLEDWANQADRMVYLEGEAYFRVKKAQAANTFRKFVVKTENIDIEVVGTSFNVNTWGAKTQVMLDEGQVKIKTKLEGEAPSVALAPGELATYSPENRSFKKEAAKSELFTAWRENRLVFEETTLEEIARLIHNSYGLEVFFAQSKLKQKTISGEIVADDLGLLLLALEKTFSISITRKENRIIFGTPEP